MLTLKSGRATLVVAPELGGAIAQLEHAGKPVLRPWNGDASAGPWAMASNILMPFSNRISNGGFRYNGVFYPVPLNLAREQYPIHGDGFQKPWQQTDTRTIMLGNGSIGPFRYRATQKFNLKPDALNVELKITNMGAVTLPFGGGFHPWFPHDHDTRLQFKARSVWLADEGKLPVKKLALDADIAWDFAKQRPLPHMLLDNCWEGWAGSAIIKQGPRFKSVKIRSSNNLGYATVYHPPNTDFLCFEPVSHLTNALNMSGQNGQIPLAPEHSITLAMDIQGSVANFLT